MKNWLIPGLEQGKYKIIWHAYGATKKETAARWGSDEQGDGKSFLTLDIEQAQFLEETLTGPASSFTANWRQPARWSA